MKRLIAFALLAAASPALAAPYADLVAIDRQVAAFTGIPQGQPGGAALPVDRRLRLAPCAASVALSWHTPRRDTVLVQCPDAGGWRLFVPVLSAPVAASTPAVTRGEAVTVAISGEGFTISQTGEAMDNGAVGSWIRVRLANGSRASTAQPLRAQIMRPGLVSVPLP